MIHHVGVSVRDLERSIAFYSAHFGLVVRRRGAFDGVPLAFLSDGGEGLLELVADAAAARPAGLHFALAVDDLDACVARLAAAGVPVLLGPTAVAALAGARVAFVAGPDGEEIELVAGMEAFRG